MSPAGTYLFAAGDEHQLVSIAYKYQIAATYVPNLTPLYDLTDDDIVGENGEDPIKVTRSDPFQAYNVWRLEIAERDNAYALVPIEVRDQDAIERYGLRVATSVSAHEICDENVAMIAGQLMLQRALYIRNTYKFKLAWEFCLLDPMDMVALNDANLGFSDYAVRIIEIEEDENGLLSVTAEEFTPRRRHRAALPDPGRHDLSGQSQHRCLAGQSAAHFRAAAGARRCEPASLGGGERRHGGIADPNWGGCNVFLSLDGTSYSQIGTVSAPARQGVTQRALAAFTGANPDTTDTLAVDLTESGGTLDSASALDAANGVTLALVDQ